MTDGSWEEMARALIVGCGCRGRELGRQLATAGWQVRGTTRLGARAAEIEAAGIEPAEADPDRVATLVDHVRDVTIVYWLLGSARGDPEAVAAIHGPRLERFLEEIVDTPVRGFVYEAAGEVRPHHRERGTEIVGAAASRWRIPVDVIDADPGEPEGWRAAMVAAAERLAGSTGTAA